MSVMASTLVLVAALAVSVTTAYPTKDEEAYYYNRLHELPDNYYKDTRNLDGIGSTDELPLFAILAKAEEDLRSQKGGGNLLRDLDMLRTRAALFNRDQRPDERSKARDYRHMDSLLGSTLGTAKRNAGSCCDSLSGVTIGTQKRNMDEIDRSSFNSFIKKNFDEIDRSGFGSFVKRNFDEIDRSGFGSFVKRSAPPARDVTHN